MSKKKDTDVQNIKAAGITKSCSIGGRTVNFRLQNVFTGEVNGKEELLDEILVDNMLEQMAKAVKTASPKPQQNENPKYAMRTWLLRLGFIGDEFKTARELYTKRLEGDTAFRNGRPQ